MRLATAFVFLAACRSTPPGPAPPASPTIELPGYRLTGCQNRVRFPTDPVLRAHIGQKTLVYVQAGFRCGEILHACWPSYSFALFADGLFVHEGPACGRAEVRLVRQLDARAMAAVRARAGACEQLTDLGVRGDPPGLHCPDGVGGAVTCRTPTGVFEASREPCTGQAHLVAEFAEGLRRQLEGDGILRDPDACARARPLLETAGELDLAIGLARRLDCTPELR